MEVSYVSQFSQSLVCSELAPVLNLLIFSCQIQIVDTYVFRCVLKDGCTVKRLDCNYQHALLMYLVLLYVMRTSDLLSITFQHTTITANQS